MSFEAVHRAYYYLQHPTQRPSQWDAFWRDAAAMPFSAIVGRYGQPAHVCLADRIIMTFGRKRWNAGLIKLLYILDYEYRKHIAKNL